MQHEINHALVQQRDVLSSASYEGVHTQLTSLRRCAALNSQLKSMSIRALDMLAWKSSVQNKGDL